MVILIVEDDTLLATTLAASLIDAGYDVIGPAATEARAIQLAELMRPDLALLDIALRDGGSGLAVARALRLQAIPCLFVSGQSDAARAARDAALAGQALHADRDAGDDRGGQGADRRQTSAAAGDPGRARTVLTPPTGPPSAAAAPAIRR